VPHRTQGSLSRPTRQTRISAEHRPSIVGAELTRAIRVESEIAVAYHTGVHRSTVWTWRRSLKIPLITNGTRRPLIENAAETLTPEVRAAAIEAMLSPEIQAVPPRDIVSEQGHTCGSGIVWALEDAS
jgi:hypothetical protein